MRGWSIEDKVRHYKDLRDWDNNKSAFVFRKLSESQYNFKKTPPTPSKRVISLVEELFKINLRRKRTDQNNQTGAGCWEDIRYDRALEFLRLAKRGFRE